MTSPRAHAVLALTAATLATRHAARFDAEKRQRGAAYHAPTRIDSPGHKRACGWFSPPRSRTDVAFSRAAGRHADADAIARSIAKRERKNARRLRDAHRERISR